MQTGVQVLFAFLLTAPLAARFTTLDRFQRLDYFVTLLVTDLLFSGAVVATTVGFATVGVALTWCVLPLRRRRRGYAAPSSASVPRPAPRAAR